PVAKNASRSRCATITTWTLDVSPERSLGRARLGSRTLAYRYALDRTGKGGHMARRTVISQLASVGEEALGQLATNPVTRRAIEGAMQVKDRVEKLVTGVSDLEKRVANLEKRLSAL